MCGNAHAHAHAHAHAQLGVLFSYVENRNGNLLRVRIMLVLRVFAWIFSYSVYFGIMEVGSENVCTCMSCSFRKWMGNYASLV